MVKGTRPLSEDEMFKANYMRALNEKFKLRMQLAHLRNQLDDIDAINERMMEEVREKKWRQDQTATKDTMSDRCISPPRMRPSAPSKPQTPSRQVSPVAPLSPKPVAIRDPSPPPSPPAQISPAKTPPSSPPKSPPPSPPRVPVKPVIPAKPPSPPQKQVSFSTVPQSSNESYPTKEPQKRTIMPEQRSDDVSERSSNESFDSAPDMPHEDMNVLEDGLRNLQRQYRDINLYSVGIILLLFSVLLMQNIKWHGRPRHESNSLAHPLKASYMIPTAVKPEQLGPGAFYYPQGHENGYRCTVGDYDCEECNEEYCYTPRCGSCRAELVDGYICCVCPKSERKRASTAIGRT